MNREQAALIVERLPVIKAFSEGKAIQYRYPDKEWNDVPTPTFVDAHAEYRVKPEPRELYEVRAKEGVGYWGEPCISMIAAERKLADAERASPGHYRIVTFREVIEEN